MIVRNRIEGLGRWIKVPDGFTPGAAGGVDLGNLSTSGPGELTLDLFMDWFDPAEHHAIWSRAATTFIVADSADEDDEPGPAGG